MNKLILLFALITLSSANLYEFSYLESDTRIVYVLDTDTTVDCKVYEEVNLYFMDKQGQYEIIRPSRKDYSQFITDNAMVVVPKKENFTIKVSKYDSDKGDSEFLIHFNCIPQFLF